jgi:hypothetical protein
MVDSRVQASIRSHLGFEDHGSDTQFTLNSPSPLSYHQVHLPQHKVLLKTACWKSWPIVLRECPNSGVVVALGYSNLFADEDVKIPTCLFFLPIYIYIYIFIFIFFLGQFFAWESEGKFHCFLMEIFCGLRSRSCGTTLKIIFFVTFPFVFRQSLEPPQWGIVALMLLLNPKPRLFAEHIL